MGGMGFAARPPTKPGVRADINNQNLDKMEQKKHIYQLELTERQARLLSWACDRMSRIVEGQDWTYQEMLEAAWEKRCKEATGKMMDEEWDGGWSAMRHEAETMCKQMKKRFWGLESNAMYGIHYDETSDILFDIHQVIRHQLWLDNPNRMPYTVDADGGMQFGTEQMASIKRIPKKK